MIHCWLGCTLPQAIFAKGANMIPMDELEGRMSAAAHRQLVRSAADAGMNTLRVWGGGIFLPRAWYVIPTVPSLCNRGQGNVVCVCAW